MSPASALADTARPSRSIAPAAQVEDPPGPSKQLLIRRFLRAIGLQDQLDTGDFLARHAMPGGSMWQASTAPAETLMGGFEKRMKALTEAYRKHRAEYQQAYEDHANWEFTEAELAEIVGFLEGPTGKHFLDGRWRMEAYVGTNMEALEQQIVDEAIASLRK